MVRMEVIPTEVQAYADRFSSPEIPVLEALNQFTRDRIENPQMISGKIQGWLLAFISQMIRPQRILEIGTFTGYSGICLCRGLMPGGRLYTIDSNEALRSHCLKVFRSAGVLDQITLMNGNALDLIPGIQEPWDLVFLDADKQHYADYYDLVFDHWKAGGFMLADNVLFHGEVFKPREEQSKAARAIEDFNNKVAADSRVERVLLTVRDGLLLIRKK